MIYLLTALGVFALDYAVKEYVDRNRLQGSEEKYFGGKLILRNYHNRDGAFGLFRGNRKLVVYLPGVVLICVAWEFLKALFVRGRAVLKFALSLILGGGASNLYDRITKGYVTDYISVGAGGKRLRGTVFNLSDFFIFAGAVLFFISQAVSIFRRK